jgi:hypothetical protein
MRLNILCNVGSCAPLRPLPPSFFRSFLVLEKYLNFKKFNFKKIEYIIYFFYKLYFTMNTFLQENNVEYKITGIYNNIYKFEINNVSIHCTIYENKKNYNENYYEIIIYVPQEIYEIKYELLQSMKKNKIKLLGIIEHMNIYKYRSEYDDVNKVIDIIQLFM